MTRRDVLRKIRNGAIGTLIVFVVMILAGVGYTWYMGTQATAEPVAEEIDEAVGPITRTPYQPAPDAAVGVSSQLLTSPVQPGENASLSIKTNPAANCEITLTYGELGEEDKQSTDSGLEPKVADAYGMVTWSWTVEASRPVGTWPVEVTCANEAKSGYLRVDLVVATEKA